MTPAGQGFAHRLRWWRAQRGVSQLQLASAAEICQRHLSFLESGRTTPSREMVLRLAAALDVPLRQHNLLLLAAGYAPAWRESDLAAPSLPSSTVRSTTCWRSRSPFLPSSSIDAGTCCAPIGGRRD
jgi:transcriptional regulator with XRE-family HTH domain